SAIARRNPNARGINARSIFISALTRGVFAACWNGRSGRCAGRKTPPTAPPTRCCRSPPQRAAVPDRACASAKPEIAHRPLWDFGFSPPGCRNDSEKLLPVIGQNFRAGANEPDAVLLQARQNDLLALIDLSAAKTRHIPHPSIMTL